MNDKCLKTSVFVNDTVYCETTEQAVDIDFTLPDYCADISKIFKCQAVPRISSKGINGKTITLDGTVLLNLLYCDKDGTLCSYEYQYPFSKNIEMPKEHSNINLCCRVNTEYINCRAVTGRKVDIHGAISIFVKVFKRKSTEIVSDIDDPAIELNKGIAPATVPMGYAEKYVLVEEELSISQGQPSVKNLLRSDVKSCIRETKIINDKAVVKGEITVCILYCPDREGNPQTVKTMIPFSQIIDVDGITETCNCETKSEVVFFEVKPRVNSNGETKMFCVTAKLLLTCTATCGNEVPVIYDAFSRKYRSEMSKNKVCFEKIILNLGETYNCKKAVELEMPVESILDLWCNVNSISTKFEDENMIISGVLITSIIAKSETNNSFYCEKSIDFEYKYPLNNYLEKAYCEPEIEILSSGYTLTSPENLELRVDLGINAAIYEKNEVSLVSDFSVDESTPAERKNRGAMVIYFPDAGEHVWDIARNYSASVEEIMKINELESDVIPEGKMILVPMI